MVSSICFTIALTVLLAPGVSGQQSRPGSIYRPARGPVSMIADVAKEKLDPRTLTTAEGWVLAVCAFFVLCLGIFPNAQGVGVFAWLRALDWSRSSVAFLF